MRIPIFSISLLSLCALRAQDCSIPFTTPLYGVQVETGITYGTAPRFDGGTDTLRMDLYKPIGDQQTERPLVVLVHGGGFTDGDRSDMADLCTSIAACGYATATISYRLGFHAEALLPNPWSYDEAEVQRAAYRGMQDTKGAIRFLKARHASDSTSTSTVFVLGVSAGAINALHAAYVRNASDKPVECWATSDVVLGGTTYPRPDLGPVDGELAQNGMDASVLAVVSLLGGVMDTTVIASNTDPALFMYHQTGDPVVGCGYNRGLWGLGFGISDNYPYIQGSCIIDQRAQHLGFVPQRYHFIEHAGNAHDIHDIPGTMVQVLAFLRQQFCTAVVGVEDRIADVALSIRPNPSSGSFRLTLPDGFSTGGSLTVIDASGREVFSTRIMASITSMDLGATAEGTYVVRYVAPDGRMVQDRLTVVR